MGAQKKVAVQLSMVTNGAPGKGRGTTLLAIQNAQWIQVGLTTLKGGSTISANAQSLHGVTST